MVPLLRSHILPFAFLFLPLVPLYATLLDEEQHLNCSTPENCAGFDITYPFFLKNNGGRDYCGHPNVGVECDDENKLTLLIHEVRYQVLNITKENQSLIVARMDILKGDCPEQSNDFTLDHRFNFTDNDLEATLLLDCSTEDYPPPQLHEFNCLPSGGYLINRLTQAPDENSSKPNCSASLKIPMLKSAAQALTDNKINAIEALEKGFEVNWLTLNVSDECSACINSWGACGHNTTLSKFSCHCKDGAHQETCFGPLQKESPSGVFCPMDLSYVLTIPWNNSPCRNDTKLSSFPPPLNDSCCNTLLSLYGIAFAQHLNETNFFELPDLDTSASCLQSFRSKLDSLNLPTNITSYCFSPSQFVIPEHSCASIKSSNDLVRHLESTQELTELNSSCRSDLTDPFNCVSCRQSANSARDKLLLDMDDDSVSNSTAAECYYFTILYAAGIINLMGPASRGVLTCIFTLPMNTGGKSRWEVKLGIVAAAVCGTAIVMSLAFFFVTRYRRKQKQASYITPRSISSHYSSRSRMDSERGGEYYGLPIFEYDVLRSATNNFDPERELGDGGFGTVFYGKLQDGRAVAVKRLYEHNYKRAEQFMNEVEILARLHHPNLVRLYGYTSRMSNRLLLVYEYVPNGTVADHLHGELAKPGSLPWLIRMNIAIQTASALVYLHSLEIIHRDVKTNNILLDENFKVKVADFGLSRLFPTNVTHVSTAPQGTPGYVDPEYHECYQLTEKSDVYSFGVVLMELISSLPAVDIMRHRHEINLSTMAINKIQNDAIHEFVDKNLGFESDYDARRMILAVAELGFRCLQNGKEMRPSMAEALEILQNIQEVDSGADKLEKNSKDVCSDDVALLKVVTSPVSVAAKWVSSENTTPNASG